MIRYQIRNEYGLSDPELYAAPGEEDDPEALLEGVAMAGLVGVLRQLGDLAEFAAEIFHDLHEDVMATASRGHGLMLRLQQLEAEFPAVEKAIISQTDHSNYPHDEGVEWHPNLQCKQNMITQGDMPRFILDSYEECRGPPHLFTLDKFDVAGAGASLKRYSDPSFFKTELSSNMIESDAVMEKKPRRIKKKAMRWRKGVTLETLLVANSESQSTSKDRAFRKVPPRTTKLKPRHPRSPDYKTISRICREHLQEVISSQQKIMLSCSARHYHVKFGSTDSSETPLPLEDFNNSGAHQPSGKLELSKVVPINESDTVDATSEPTNGSGYLELDGKPILGKRHGLTELKEGSKKSTKEQNVMICDSEKLQDRPDLLVAENNQRLQSAREGKLTFAVSHADQVADGCRSDDIASDDNFVDALNSMDTEGVINPEMKERDPDARVEGNGLNHRSKGDENALEAKFVEVGHAIESSPGLIVSSDIEEPTCLDLPLINDYVPLTVATTSGPHSGSPSGRKLNGDEEPFNDEDLMDVSSSSSVVSDNADSHNIDNSIGRVVSDTADLHTVDDSVGVVSDNVDLHSIDDSVGRVVSDDADIQTIDDSVDRQQFQDGAYQSLNAAFVHSFDEQSPKTSSGLNGLTISSNECADKKCHSVNRDQNSVPDGSSMSMDGPNDVLEDEEEINVGDADELLLHPTKYNKEEWQASKKELEECKSLGTGTSRGTIAALPDKDHVMCMNDLDMDDVGVPEENVVDPTPAVLDPDKNHEHLHGIAPTHPNMRNNLSYESNEKKIVEDVDSLPDDDIPIPVNKHDTEDKQVVVLDEGTYSARLGTQKGDSVESSAMVKDFAYVHELPGGIQGESPSQDEREVYKGETVAPSSCLFNDDTEPLNTGPCEEYHELIEMENTPECSKIVVTEESTTIRFADGLILPEEEITDAAKYSDKVEVLAAEEDCRHDVQFQSSSPFSGELETVEATCRNFGALDESRKHISKQSILQTNDVAFNEIETAGGKCSETDAVHLLSSAHFPEASDCEYQLLEEASLNAEVLSGFDNSDKNGAVSLNNNAAEKQPQNVDQDLVWRVTTLDSSSDTVKKQTVDTDQDFVCDYAQDSSSTNPFMDPAYITSHTQIHPYPTMGYQSCFPEEEDFLSEQLIEHDIVGAPSDSLWEPATPPDEEPSDSLWEPATPPDGAPLPSEVMTEEDFRSFYHEYHEINFTAGTGSCHDESTSDSNNNSNSFVVSESDWDCHTSVQPVKLDQEASNGSTFSSQTQHADYSSATDAHADTSLPFSMKNDLEDETPKVDSQLKSHDSLSDNRSCEDMLSVPGGLQEQHNLYGVDSHSSSLLFDKEKKDEDEESCSPSSNIVAVKEDPENDASPVPHSSANENMGERDVPPSNAVPVELEAGTHVFDEHNKDVPFCISDKLDSPNDSPFSIDEDKNSTEASLLKTSFGTENDSECLPSDEHDSQIALSSSLDETTVELEGHPVGNAILLDQDPEVSGLDSQIIPRSSADEKIYEHDLASLSSSVLVDLDSEDHVLGDRDFRGTPCSLVKDTQQNCVLSEEQEQDARMSRVLDSQIASCSFNINKVGEIDGSLQMESEESNRSTEFDSQTAPCSSSSAVLADRTASPRIMHSTDKRYQMSFGPPSPVTFQNGSYEDPQRPPPLPPLQWRLGRPRLGLLNTQGYMPESARGADSILQASNLETETGLGFLDQTNRSVEPVSSEGIKEDMDKSSMTVEANDQNVEFRGVSPNVRETDIARPFSKASENLKQQEHSSSAIGVEEHLDDNTGVISKTGVEQHLEDNIAVMSNTGVEQHLDNSGITHGTDLYPTNPPTYEPPDCHLHTLSSDTSEKYEHPTHMHRAASEDDRSVNDHNVAVDMDHMVKGHIYESRCYQIAEHNESSSENLEHNGHISNASEVNNSLTYEFITSEAPSGSTNRCAPDLLLELEHNQERHTLQEQNSESSEDSPLEGSVPIAESMATQDYPNDRHNLEREKMNQPSRLGPVVDGLDEGSNVPAQQRPVMGWTVGPQMLHPNYGASIEERPFQLNSTDNHLILKPISIRNIPRNPLVDAVAAHDRSSMRKVSELTPATDKPKSNERNLLLEQIRNKTFNLKPASSPMPIAIRSPARADTRNLKVAAIIEKANAIRQAVGSDDEDGDNWSD